MESLKDRISVSIRDNILRNIYTADGFLTEGRLAQEFGVSRAPIREALVQLCNQGILRNIPRAGYQIVQLSPRDIREAIHTRVILEVAAARAALPRFSDINIRRLEEATGRASAAGKSGDISPEQWWEHNIGFHLIISECAGNSLLTEMILRTVSILRRAIGQFFRDSEPSKYLAFNSGSHEAILSAIKQGDEEALVAEIRDDILTLGKIFRVS